MFIRLPFEFPKWLKDLGHPTSKPEMIDGKNITSIKEDKIRVFIDCAGNKNPLHLSLA